MSIGRDKQCGLCHSVLFDHSLFGVNFWYLRITGICTILNTGNGRYLTLTTAAEE